MVLVVVDVLNVTVLIPWMAILVHLYSLKGVYIGEGLGELDEELDFRDRADICLLFGGGGSSDPISSSACNRS